MRTIILIAALIVCASCGDDATGARADAETARDNGGMDDVGDEEMCEATLAWLQKDAYREVAGRNWSFWPPHTTMTLEVVCTPAGGSPDQVALEVRTNHGTSPTDVDAEGTTILESVRSETVVGTREELSGLRQAFEECECGTTFLSLDELSDATVEQLIGELVNYVTANLECSGPGGTSAVVDALVAKNVEEVLTLGADCTWAGGLGWDEAFNDALGAVATASSQTLADYHVCNNDAELQALLWRQFVTSRSTTACDTASPLCSGPRWFYAPPGDE